VVREWLAKKGLQQQQITGVGTYKSPATLVDFEVGANTCASQTSQLATLFRSKVVWGQFRLAVCRTTDDLRAVEIA
jgi:hypothetical protein